MSQQRNSQPSNLPSTSQKSKLNIPDAAELEKMSPHEQKALLAELEQELKAGTVQEAAPLLEFVLSHIKTIISVIIIAIIVIAGWGMWQWNSENAQAEATREFQKIVDIQDPQQKLNALVEFSKSAPSNLAIGILVEEASTASVVKNYELASVKLQEAIEADKNSALSLTLYLALADVYILDNKADKALALMEEYIKIIPENLYTVALEEIAIIAETMGNKEKALSSYKELLEKTDATATTAQSFYKARISQLSK